MKKLIYLLLTLVLVLAIAPSCTINKTEVSVLWSNYKDEYLFTIADAFDRGAYIENIKHVDYDAENSASKQLEQADTVIANGCTALVVNPVDAVTATQLLSKAKEANLPILFLCSDALSDAAIKTALAIESYDKCALVNVDASTCAEVLSKKIVDDLAKNLKSYDRNGDNTITYLPLGAGATAIANAVIEAAKANDTLKNITITMADISLLDAALSAGDFAQLVKNLFSDWTEESKVPFELIISDSDTHVESVLLALRGVREKGFNYKELKTHFIPFYTVGISTNASKLLINDRPGAEIEQEELDAYSVMNTIDSGYVSASALVDDDAIALSTAAILRNLITGKDLMNGVIAEYVSGNTVSVPYTIYG